MGVNPSMDGTQTEGFDYAAKDGWLQGLRMKPAGACNTWDSASSLSLCTDQGLSKTLTSQRLIPRMVVGDNRF